jgi:hypothetical protein
MQFDTIAAISTYHDTVGVETSPAILVHNNNWPLKHSCEI